MDLLRVSGMYCTDLFCCVQSPVPSEYVPIYCTVLCCAVLCCAVLCCARFTVDVVMMYGVLRYYIVYVHLVCSYVWVESGYLEWTGGDGGLDISFYEVLYSVHHVLCSGTEYLLDGRINCVLVGLWIHALNALVCTYCM